MWCRSGSATTPSSTASTSAGETPKSSRAPASSEMFRPTRTSPLWSTTSCLRRPRLAVGGVGWHHVRARRVHATQAEDRIDLREPRETRLVNVDHLDAGDGERPYTRVRQSSREEGQGLGGEERGGAVAGEVDEGAAVDVDHQALTLGAAVPTQELRGGGVGDVEEQHARLGKRHRHRGQTVLHVHLTPRPGGAPTPRPERRGRPPRAPAPTADGASPRHLLGLEPVRSPASGRK